MLQMYLANKKIKTSSSEPSAQIRHADSPSVHGVSTFSRQNAMEKGRFDAVQFENHV